MEDNHNFSKEPWLAVVPSLCWAGIGQIYTGRIQRGIILILTEIILSCLAIWSLLIPKCDTLISIGLLLALIAIKIWNLFDAHKCARTANSQDFEDERKQNKDPWLALFLSNFIPGFGQLYLRKWLLGILFIIIAGGDMVGKERNPNDNRSDSKNPNNSAFKSDSYIHEISDQHIRDMGKFHCVRKPRLSPPTISVSIISSVTSGSLLDISISLSITSIMSSNHFQSKYFRKS